MRSCGEKGEEGELARREPGLELQLALAMTEARDAQKLAHRSSQSGVPHLAASSGLVGIRFGTFRWGSFGTSQLSSF